MNTILNYKQIAQELIDNNDSLIYDVASYYGQDANNIKHTKNFLNLVIDWLKLDHYLELKYKFD